VLHRSELMNATGSPITLPSANSGDERADSELRCNLERQVIVKQTIAGVEQHGELVGKRTNENPARGADAPCCRADVVFDATAVLERKAWVKAPMIPARGTGFEISPEGRGSCGEIDALLELPASNSRCDGAVEEAAVVAGAGRTPHLEQWSRDTP